MTATPESARELLWAAARNKSHLYLTPDDVTVLWDSIVADTAKRLEAEDQAEELMNNLHNTADELRLVLERRDYFRERALYWRKRAEVR